MIAQRQYYKMATLDLGFSYWVIFGVVYLAILTYQDFKHNKLVDDRYNFLMKGLTISLLTHTKQPLFYILAVYFIITPLIWWLLKKYSTLGAGDVKSIVWSFTGLALINLAAVITYSGLLVLLTIIYISLKVLVFKNKEPIQYYPVILSSFIIVCLLFNLLKPLI